MIKLEEICNKCVWGVNNRCLKYSDCYDCPQYDTDKFSCKCCLIKDGEYCPYFELYDANDDTYVRRVEESVVEAILQDIKDGMKAQSELEDRLHIDDAMIAEYDNENKKLLKDLYFVLRHPLEGCKVCKFRDRECSRTGQDCNPEWRGVRK